MKQQIVEKKLENLIKPIVTRMDYELYYAEFIKENGENYLRIYIDHENRIGLEDCEKVSREVSEMLDIEDPIEESYFLEVCSPGIERRLYNDSHLEKYIDFNINIKLKSLFNGRRSLDGLLKKFDHESLIVECENEDLTISKDNIKSINLISEI